MTYTHTWVFTAIVVMIAGMVQATELDQLPVGDADRAFELVSAHAGATYDTVGARELTVEELADALVGARVILLGEEHTAIEQKLLIAQLLEQLAERVPRLVLGMEFFQREDDESLRRWGQGEIGYDELLAATEWYDRGGYRFEYYRPIMDAALNNAIPVVGLNVPREIPRTVNMRGLDGLTDEQRELVGAVDTDNSPQHRYLISRYFGDTVARLPGSWLDNMYAAQCVWDVVMARSIIEAMDDGGTVVVVVGSGHVAYDLGIGRRIHEELAATATADVRVATYCPVRAPAPDPEGEPSGHPMGGREEEADRGPKALFARSLADYVGVFADTGGVEAYPRLGLRLKADEDGTPMVSMVWPDTLAETVGFASGDRILDVNGQAPSDLSHLRLMLARLQWGDRVDVRVRQGEETIDRSVILVPALETVDASVAPGWEVKALGAFDAAGVEPLSGSLLSRDEDEVRRVMVLHDEKPVRVEVWTGDVVSEIHELDPDQRVMRSLYRDPQPDGAVEIRYQRADDGSVEASERFDRAGMRVDVEG